MAKSKRQKKVSNLRKLRKARKRELGTLKQSRSVTNVATNLKPSRNFGTTRCGICGKRNIAGNKECSRCRNLMDPFGRVFRTKICPNCNRTRAASREECNCGYSFVEKLVLKPSSKKRTLKRPKIKDYGLEEKDIERVDGFERITDFFYERGLIYFVGFIIGGLLGIDIMNDSSVNLSTSIPDTQGLVGAFLLGLAGAVIGPLLGFLIVAPIKFIKDKFPNKTQIAITKYQTALKRFEYHKKMTDKEAVEKKERARLKSNWENTLHGNLARNHKFVDGGLSRVRGRKLLQLIDWKEFERVLADILRYRGWEVRLTSQGADGGVDVEGTMGTRKLLVQAKHFKSGNNVGRRDLDRLLGVAVRQGATNVILAASSDFTRQVKSEPNGNLDFKLELWDGHKIASIIDDMSPEAYDKMIEPMKKALIKRL